MLDLDDLSVEKKISISSEVVGETLQYLHGLTNSNNLPKTINGKLGKLQEKLDWLNRQPQKDIPLVAKADEAKPTDKKA